MQTLTVGLGERSYPIHIGGGLFERADLLLPHLPDKKAAVVTNTTVASLYLEPLRTVLQNRGVDSRLRIPASSPCTLVEDHA